MKINTVHQGIRGGWVFMLAIMAITWSGCEKEPQKPEGRFPDKIVFGYYLPPSSCFGETCIEIFSLESGKLMEDTNDFIPTASEAYNGNFTTQLSAAKYNQIIQIFNQPVPDELLATPSGTVGFVQEFTTNYYFEYHGNGLHGHWILDGSFSGNVPANIQNFISVVSTAAFTAAN